MTGGLARPPLSPTGLQKRPICRTEANKKLQKDIYYFIAVILSLNISKLYSVSLNMLFYYLFIFMFMFVFVFMFVFNLAKCLFIE
jgi:hypothetical protein